MGAINSMTGFGKAEVINDKYRVSVEIKSVNHRYLDLSIKMPRCLNCFEARIRKLLKSYLERGKADLYITYEDYADSGKRLIYNSELAAEYLAFLNRMSDELGLKADVNASTIARMPDVLTMSESPEDDEKLWDIIEPALCEAGENFRADREREGAQLVTDLMMKLDLIGRYVDEIISFSPSVIESYRERLYNRVKETLSDSRYTVDESRIVTEVAIYADKVCTDEETVRLKSHVDAMKKRLLAGGSCGRELDFIAQEMNREANTTLSKANSLSIADTAIALKTEIEKIREQVQNIE